MLLLGRFLDGSLLESVLFNLGSAKEGGSDVTNSAGQEIYLGCSDCDLTAKSWRTPHDIGGKKAVHHC